MKRHPIEERIDEAVAQTHRLVVGYHAPMKWTEGDDAKLLLAVMAARTGDAPVARCTQVTEDDRGNLLVERRGCIGAVGMDGMTTYFDLLFQDGVLVATYHGHDYGHPCACYLHAGSQTALDEVAELVRRAATGAGLELHTDVIRHDVPRSSAEPLRSTRRKE